MDWSQVGPLVTTAALSVANTILMTGGGYLMALLGVITPQGNKMLGRVAFELFLPCLLWYNVAVSLNPERFLYVLIICVYVSAMYITGLAVGWIGAKLFNSPRDLRNPFIGAVAFPNCVNLPLSVMAAILTMKDGPFSDVKDIEEKSNAYLSLYMCFCVLFFWSLGYWLMITNQAQRMKDTELRPILKEVRSSPSLVTLDNKVKLDETSLLEDGIQKSADAYDFTWRGRTLRVWRAFRKTRVATLMFQPPFIALFFALIAALTPGLRWFLFETDMRTLTSAANSFGQAAAPCVLIVLGANLAFVPLGSTVPRRVITGASVCRLVVGPIIGILLTWAGTAAGITMEDKVLEFLFMLEYASPPAINLVVLCQMGGYAEAETSVLLFYMYLVSVVTLTIFITIFLALTLYIF